MVIKQLPNRIMVVWFTTVLIVAIATAQVRSSEEVPESRLDAMQRIQSDNPENPLRPADTSSPRDTLRSFLADSAVVIGDQQQNAILSPEGARAYMRALSTLDFSTTPDSNSRMIMNERLAMLYDILARIALPPESNIPGDDDVADGDIDQWTVPGSQITIQRIEKGSRAGEFLFSSWTVQRLPRFYRMVKHLPYQPDAIPGVLEKISRAKTSIYNREKAIRNRLKPVDTSSPRATLDGFLDSVNRAYTLVMETDAALRADPPELTLEEARTRESAALNLMERAQAALDLSRVPEAIRNDMGLESVLQLKEIIDRMTLPPIEAVPDAEMIAVQRERRGKSDAAVHWRYPNTMIEIAEIMEGEKQGQFLFSAESVDRLKAYYEKVRDLPYSPDISLLNFEYQSPDQSKGFYDFYISTPGYLVPHLSFVGRSVERLPEGFKTIYRGQTIGQWVFFALTIFALALAAVLVHIIIKRFTRKIKEPFNQWLKILTPVIIVGLVRAAIYFVDNDINVTGGILLIVITVGSAVVTALWAWVVYGICRAIADTVVALPQIPEESVQASLLHLSSRVVGALLFAWVFVEGLNRLGVNIVPLVASLGVGGLAVALAARPTMENIISSFMIYLDKPFRVGQRVNVLGQNGTVESIGLRSTRIRLLTGPLTSIPNEKMVTAEVENIGRRPYIRRWFNVTITYNTPPEKINRAVEILKEILSVPEEVIIEKVFTPVPPAPSASGGSIAPEQQQHPNEAINVPEYEPRVYFNELNSDSLNILVVYYYHPPEYWDYLEHANWVNIQIMERFNTEGINFAFPTQTLHLAGDSNHPIAVNQHWESEEETFSPSAVLAQAAALGVQVARQPQRSASNAIRPEPKERDDARIRVDGDLSDAPIEDDIIDGNAEDDGDADR